MAPLVSVVIPTYNRAKDLARALASLKAQSFTEFEVLVMDDGSSDNSRDVVEAYNDPRFNYEWAEGSGGPARPRNRGIERSAARYVAFLDSDDWWISTKLEQSVKTLESGADVVYHDLIRVGGIEVPFFPRKVPTRQLAGDAFSDLLVNGNALNTSSVVARRSLISRIGGFREDRDLVAMEDYDAWIRLSRITNRFRRIDKALGYYWQGGGNITNPARTIRNLETLEKRYSKELSALRREHPIHWIAYTKARAHFLLGNSGLAKAFLSQIPWRSSPLSINLKRSWMLAYLRFENKNG